MAPSSDDVVEFPIASAADSYYLTEGGYTVSLRGLLVTRGFVDGLGVSVAAGRRFTEQDFLPGSESVALIGHSLWRDRFGSHPAAIGRLIRAEPESRPGTPQTFRIVGVISPGFYYGRHSRTSVDLLVPHAGPVRTYMVRLRERVPPAAAERRLTEAEQGPAGAHVAALTEGEREELRLALRRRLLGDGPDRSFTLRARAWAVRGIVP